MQFWESLPVCAGNRGRLFSVQWCLSNLSVAEYNNFAINSWVLCGWLCFHGCKSCCIVLVCIALSHLSDPQHDTHCWEGSLETSRGRHSPYLWVAAPLWGRIFFTAKRELPETQFLAVTPCYNVCHNHPLCKILSRINSCS